MTDRKAMQQIELMLGKPPEYAYKCRLREGDEFMGKNCVVGGDNEVLVFTKETGFEWEEAQQIRLEKGMVQLKDGGFFSEVHIVNAELKLCFEEISRSEGSQANDIAVAA